MRVLARPLDSWDIAKLAGLMLMFIDHGGIFFFPENIWFRAIGRGAAPIFLFLAGFAPCYRLKMDLLLLAVMMAVTEIIMAGQLRALNILFAILGCRMIFYWMEQRGKRVERPFEWFIGALACAISMVVVQYGSFALLFALCGYLKKYAERYSPRVIRSFWLLTFICYGVSQAFMLNCNAGQAVAIALVLVLDYAIFQALTLMSVTPAWFPPILALPAKLISYYSGYIYVIHLLALEWFTHTMPP